MNCNTPLSEAAVWSLPLWGRGGISLSPYKDNLMGGKNVQEYGVKTIKSVENKYLWSTFLVEVLVCLDEADRQK